MDDSHVVDLLHRGIGGWAGPTPRASGARFLQARQRRIRLAAGGTGLAVAGVLAAASVAVVAGWYARAPQPVNGPLSTQAPLVSTASPTLQPTAPARPVVAATPSRKPLTTARPKETARATPTPEPKPTGHESPTPSPSEKPTPTPT